MIERSLVRAKEGWEVWLGSGLTGLLAVKIGTLIYLAGGESASPTVNKAHHGEQPTQGGDGETRYRDWIDEGR